MRAVSGAHNRAKRTWSEYLQCWFASATEARRAAYLTALEGAGVIVSLELQPRYILSERNPRVAYTADFRYSDEDGKVQIEDVKGGPITRELRVKLAWLKERGINVTLVRWDGHNWQEESFA